MKKIVRLTESQLVSLIKKSINEVHNTPKFIGGCNNFPEKSEIREWCDNSKQKIQLKINDIKEKIEYVKSLLTSGYYDDLLDNIEFYNEEHSFFSDRISQLNEVKSYLSGCTNFNSSIEEYLNTIRNKSIFVKRETDKWEYYILNKLESNYSALAFLLTTFREKNNLINLPFDSVFNRYFIINDSQLNNGEESYFTNFLINYFSGGKNEVEIMKKVLDTMEETTKIGAERERDAYEYLVSLFGSENVKDYTGNYSFVDMFGIDFMVYSKTLGWIPVQVKSSEKYLFGSTKLCNNLAMGKKYGKWVIRRYNGDMEVKSF
jgi:hypothetical protein